jgi:hypothetical protein
MGDGCFWKKLLIDVVGKVVSAMFFESGFAGF